MRNESGVLAVLDAIGCGALVLDAKGRVLETNGRARRYLGLHLDIRRQGAAQSDHLANEALQIALREAMRKSSQVEPRLGSFITVPRETARPLLLRRILMPGNPDSEDPMAALIVLDMDDCPLPDEDLLRDVFLLTPAEVRLARNLSCGKSLVEIAEEVGVGVQTLRVQLKMLFVKTGTRRQGELISLLAHLSRLNPEK